MSDDDVFELSLNPAVTVGLVVMEGVDDDVIDCIVDEDGVDEPKSASVLLLSTPLDVGC